MTISARATACSCACPSDACTESMPLAALVDRPAQRLHVLGGRLAAGRPAPMNAICVESIGAEDRREQLEQRRRPATAGRPRRPRGRAIRAARRRRARPSRRPGRPRRRGSAAASSGRSACGRPRVAAPARRTARTAAAPTSRRRARGRRGCRAAARSPRRCASGRRRWTRKASPALGRQRDPPALGLEAHEARSTPPGCGSSRRRRWRARSGPCRRRPRPRRTAARAARRAGEVPRVARRRRTGAARLTGRIPHSGSFVEPTMTKPASCSRWTTLWSIGGGKSPMKSDANVSRLPATGAVVLDRDRDAGERPRVVGADRRRPRPAPPRRTRR